VSRSSARKSASPAAQSASRSARAAAFSSRMARSSVSRSPPIPPAFFGCERLENMYAAPPRYGVFRGGFENPPPRWVGVAPTSPRQLGRFSWDSWAQGVGTIPIPIIADRTDRGQISVLRARQPTPGTPPRSPRPGPQPPGGDPGQPTGQAAKSEPFATPYISGGPVIPPVIFQAHSPPHIHRRRFLGPPTFRHRRPHLQLRDSGRDWRRGRLPGRHP
jgi:hypothetical protein